MKELEKKTQELNIFEKYVFMDEKKYIYYKNEFTCGKII